MKVGFTRIWLGLLFHLLWIIIQVTGGCKNSVHWTSLILAATWWWYHTTTSIIQWFLWIVITWLITTTWPTLPLRIITTYVAWLYTTSWTFIHYTYLHLVIILLVMISGRIRWFWTSLSKWIGSLFWFKQINPPVIVIVTLGMITQGSWTKQILQNGTILRTVIIVTIALFPAIST